MWGTVQASKGRIGSFFGKYHPILPVSVQSLRWPLFFSTVLGVLIFSLYASFIFNGTAAWLVGLVYIAYDTVLLSFMVISSQRAVTRQEERQRTHPVVSPLPGPRPT